MCSKIKRCINFYLNYEFGVYIKKAFKIVAFKLDYQR